MGEAGQHKEGCGAVRCGAVRCGAVGCDAARRPCNLPSFDALINRSREPAVGGTGHYSQ